MKKIITALAICCFSLTTSASADTTELLQQLSLRHMKVTDSLVTRLENAHGGAKSFVEYLREVSRQDSVPHASLRAAYILVKYYAEEPSVEGRVSEIIGEDFASNRRGLAKVYVKNLDGLKSAAKRREIAELAINRGKQDEDFRALAKRLEQSNDSAVRKLAREELN